MTIPDCIERIEILPVSRERVWDAITKPEQNSQWFDIVRDIDFRVGGTINFTWEKKTFSMPSPMFADGGHKPLNGGDHE